MGGHMRIERNLVGAVPPAPEPVPVPRLVHGNAVDPGAQRGLPAKSGDGAKNAEENFLGKVERFVAVAKEVHGKLNDHPLVLGYELGEGHFIT